jgi:hypothetical protein
MSSTATRDPVLRFSNAPPRTATIGGLALLAQLVEHLHGKEGVDGSSPSEGSAKVPETGAFSFRSICSSSNVRWVWGHLWSFQFQNGRESASSLATAAILELALLRARGKSEFARRSSESRSTGARRAPQASSVTSHRRLRSRRARARSSDLVLGECPLLTSL